MQNDQKCSCGPQSEGRQGSVSVRSGAALSKYKHLWSHCQRTLGCTSVSC